MIVFIIHVFAYNRILEKLFAFYLFFGNMSYNVIPHTFIKLYIHCINTDELAILRYLTGLAFYMAFDLSNMTIYKVLLLIKLNHEAVTYCSLR